MKGRPLAAFLVMGLALVAGRAYAHHSFAAEFDADKPISVKGVVTQVRLENPHSWFFLDATGADGKVEKWAFEANPNICLLCLHRPLRLRGECSPARARARHACSPLFLRTERLCRRSQ